MQGLPIFPIAGFILALLKITGQIVISWNVVLVVTFAPILAGLAIIAFILAGIISLAIIFVVLGVVYSFIEAISKPTK